MEVWDWSTFWSEFAPPVLVASVLLWFLGMAAKWAYSRKREVILWSVLWLMMATLLGFVFMVLRPSRPVEVVLDSGMEARPYFTKSQSSINTVSTDNRERALFTVLTVSVQNNNKPAKNVISQMMLLDESLDPTNKPLRTRRIENANDIGRLQTLSQHTQVSVRSNTRPAFVVFEIHYSDALTDEAYSQIWFMKFPGSSQDGTFIQTLFDASYDERKRIESYIEQRKIPMLSVLGG